MCLMIFLTRTPTIRCIHLINAIWIMNYSQVEAFLHYALNPSGVGKVSCKQKV